MAPQSLASTLVAEKAKLHATSPWIWCYEIAISATQAFRLTTYQTDIVLREGAGPTYDAVTFEAFNVSWPEIKTDSAGTLNGLDLTISAISMETAAYLDTLDVTAHDVRVVLVHSDHLGDVNNATPKALEERFQIMAVRENLNSIVLSLGHWTLLRKSFPSVRFMRKCRFAFAGAECAWVGQAATGFEDGFDVSKVSTTECDKSLNGTNGCRGHGALAKLSLAPVHHPLRFGGFPGIPRGGVAQ